MNFQSASAWVDMEHSLLDVTQGVVIEIAHSNTWATAVFDTNFVELMLVGNYPCF